MAIRERLIYAIDVVTTQAQQGLKGFRQSVNDAEGATGKFKAGASSAFSTVQANAGALAVGAGAALVTFGVKSVQAFTEGALAAGKFSDASGLAVEDASRWQEVAGDLGVSAETFAGGFLKLEKAIASNGPAIKGLGIEVVKTADGQADMNATMLDAIDRLGGIKDPAEKAKAATELFGRGFGDMAEIVLGDADDIKKRLGEVADAQVFDAGEVEKARKFRDAMDNLQDSMQEISLVVGEALVPALTDAADGVTRFRNAIDDLPGVPKALQVWFDYLSPKAMLYDNMVRLGGAAVDFGKGLFGIGGGGDEAARGTALFDAAIQNIADKLVEGAAAQERINETIDDGNPAFSLMADNLEHNAEALAEKAEWDEKAAEAADRHTEALEAVAGALEEQRDAALELVGGDIAVRNAQRDAAEAAEELTTVLENQETTLADAGAAIDEAADAQLNAASAAADYRAKQMEANGQSVDAATKAQLFKEELERLAGNLSGPLLAAVQNYIDQLNAIPKTIGTTIVLNRPGRVGDFAAPVFGGKFHSGGIVPGPAGAERMILAKGGEQVLTPQQQRAGVGGGGNYTINLYGGQATPEAVIDAIKKWERGNGTAWRS
jgi:hypothetical protein